MLHDDRAYRFPSRVSVLSGGSPVCPFKQSPEVLSIVAELLNAEDECGLAPDMRFLMTAGEDPRKKERRVEWLMTCSHRFVTFDAVK